MLKIPTRVPGHEMREISLVPLAAEIPLAALILDRNPEFARGPAGQEVFELKRQQNLFSS